MTATSTTFMCYTSDSKGATWGTRTINETVTDHGLFTVQMFTESSYFAETGQLGPVESRLGSLGELYLASSSMMSVDACFTACGEANVAVPQSEIETLEIKGLIPTQGKVWVGLKKDDGAWGKGGVAYAGYTDWHTGEGNDGSSITTPRRAAIYSWGAGWHGDWQDMANDGREHYCVCRNGE